MSDEVVKNEEISATDRIDDLIIELINRNKHLEEKIDLIEKALQDKITANVVPTMDICYEYSVISGINFQGNKMYYSQMHGKDGFYANDLSKAKFYSQKSIAYADEAALRNEKDILAEEGIDPSSVKVTRIYMKEGK